MIESRYIHPLKAAPVLLVLASSLFLYVCAQSQSDIQNVTIDDASGQVIYRNGNWNHTNAAGNAFNNTLSTVTSVGEFPRSVPHVFLSLNNQVRRDC